MALWVLLLGSQGSHVLGQEFYEYLGCIENGQPEAELQEER